MFFSDSAEKIPSHPNLISGRNSDAGTNLEFPLSGHDLCVDSRDLNSSVEASLVVIFCDLSAIAIVGTD